jgi:CDP-glycerol glycerophosphotransferase (TagB/SpsB family)
MYRKGSLDHYDMVFMVGDWQASSIRELEAKRGLEPKELISLGLPYLDLYQRDLKQIEPGERPCILVASSWGQKGLLLTYGIGFIKALAANYRVILRPHPQSYKSEAKAMAAFEKDLQDYAVLWDKQLSPVDSLQQAELLISDTSSIRFDFAFLCQKPVITLEVEAEAMPGFERDDMDELWMDQAATKIGIKLGKEDIPQICRYVDAALKDYDPQSAIVYRDTVIQNFANAGDSIAEYLVELTSPR